jgi:hypothetical protein
VEGRTDGRTEGKKDGIHFRKQRKERCEEDAVEGKTRKHTSERKKTIE